MMNQIQSQIKIFKDMAFTLREDHLDHTLTYRIISNKIAILYASIGDNESCKFWQSMSIGNN